MDGLGSWCYILPIWVYMALSVFMQVEGVSSGHWCSLFGKLVERHDMKQNWCLWQKVSLQDLGVSVSSDHLLELGFTWIGWVAVFVLATNQCVSPVKFVKGTLPLWASGLLPQNWSCICKKTLNCGGKEDGHRSCCSILQGVWKGRLGRLLGRDFREWSQGMTLAMPAVDIDENFPSRGSNIKNLFTHFQIRSGRGLGEMPVAALTPRR